MPTPSFTAVDVSRIVAEVLARLQSGAETPRPAAAARPSTYGRPQQAAGVAIPDKVLTLALLEKLPAGTRQINVVAGAVVTPSAREFARDTGIEIVRTAGAGAGTNASPRPLVIGRADCAADVSGRCAAIARGVPGSQQLPATGLADAIDAFALHVSRDGARAILLTGRPAVAVVLANRSASLRAATARDAATLLAAATECAANLLVVNPKDFSAGSLERVCVDFARRDLGPSPAELQSAATPCACQSHSH
ncbi:MAG: hypothetical protein NTW36_04600 [Planctomycetia bacterium]|nr:hypothetical protein [Planctomycetia bacterium]